MGLDRPEPHRHFGGTMTEILIINTSLAEIEGVDEWSVRFSVDLPLSEALEILEDKPTVGFNAERDEISIEVFGIEEPWDVADQLAGRFDRVLDTGVHQQVFAPTSAAYVSELVDAL